MAVKTSNMGRCKRLSLISQYPFKTKEWLCKGFKLRMLEKIGCTKCEWNGYPPNGIKDCEGYESRNDREKL